MCVWSACASTGPVLCTYCVYESLTAALRSLCPAIRSASKERGCSAAVRQPRPVKWYLVDLRGGQLCVCGSEAAHWGQHLNCPCSFQHSPQPLLPGSSPPQCTRRMGLSCTRDCPFPTTCTPFPEFCGNVRNSSPRQWSAKGMNMDTEAILPWVQMPAHLLALWSWESCLISLCLISSSQKWGLNDSYFVG